ncbi:MAG TPA: hypothetical protein VNG33_04775 [Polyangiaceae bacterium]|nr:hypothetical protein [Polyangiaceae bacterium]
MKRLITSARTACGLGLLLGSVGCGGRPSAWDTAFTPGVQADAEPGDPSGNLQVRGLTGSVALLDPAQNQVMMLTSPEHFALASTRLPVGRDVVQFDSSVDRDRLFVLSRGVTPRYLDSDEPPQLRVFDGGIAPKQVQNYVLQDPYNQLEIDPQGEWLIVHGSEGLVSNPNELILVRLPKPGASPGSADALVSKTLNSYGGKPVRFTFTSELTVPGVAARRLLVVQREKDLAIIDLENLDAPETTVGLPLLPTGDFASPTDVVYHAGIDGEVNSMLAVQLNDSNVFILTLNESSSAAHAFSLDGNEVDVGGVPSKLDFVLTQKDGGLRLAALVPTKRAAVLVEPASGVTQAVPLPAAFTRIRRITSDVSANSGQDIALLYGETTNTIAFWQLGTTTGTPYRSIDAYDIGINVAQVLDIPGEKYADRKILSGGSTGSKQQFYVLDLAQRKSFPLDVLTNLTLNLSPTGEELWAFEKDATGFAQLTFDPLQPSSLYTQKPIAFVHDFETQHGGDERTALALHILPSNGHSSVAATLFDGLDPNTAQTRFYSELELAGIK